MSDQAAEQPSAEEMEAIRAWKAEQAKLTRLDKVRNAFNGVDPWILTGLGALVLVIWAVATITQIRTSEALMLHGQRVPMNVEWGVLFQPFQLLSGTTPLDYVMPYCYGWIIEVLTLIWSFALEHAKNELLKANKTLGSIYGTITVLLIGLNGWADYNSSPGGDPLQQGLLAGAVGLMVTTGLPIGLVLVKAGLGKMKHSS